VRLLNQPSGDDHAYRSQPARDIERHPDRSWRNLRFVQTEPIELADTSLSPANGEKMSKHAVCGGDARDCWQGFRDRKKRRYEQWTFPIIAI